MALEDKLQMAMSFECQLSGEMWEQTATNPGFISLLGPIRQSLHELNSIESMTAEMFYYSSFLNTAANGLLNR